MAAPPIDFLNSFFWQFTTVIVAIVAVIGFLVYRYYLEPPIARWFTSARWSKGPVGFIQDDANNVHLVTSQAALPEGIIYTKRGFFMQSRAPYIPSVGSRKASVSVDIDGIVSDLKAKYPDAPDEALFKMAQEQAKILSKMTPKRGPGRPKEDDRLSDEQLAALGCALQTPTLAGFGRAVFFGYDGAPLVSNLKTLAFTSDTALTVENKEENGKVWRSVNRYIGHSDLRVMKEIIPATISRTQLGNLYRWALEKGYRKKGGDTTKLLIICIAAAIPIACLGIVAFMLINGGGA